MINPHAILITGASSGLGAALAVLYASPETCLFLHGRDAARLETVAAQTRAKGSKTEIFVGDVRDAPNLAAWITHCDATQPLDLVIANAGISAGTGEKREGAEVARAVFDINVQGVLNTIHPALALMTARNRGQVALISSLASFRGLPGAPAYCASKAAVRLYGEALRAEMAGQGVAVNVVCPGFIKTPMTGANGFPMPILLPVEKAAQIIRAGLAKNTARIAFPLRLYALVRLMAALPQPVMDFIASRLPRKR